MFSFCHRQPLYVNFTAIHYDRWIIAPAGFQVFVFIYQIMFETRLLLSHWIIGLWMRGKVWFPIERSYNSIETRHHSVVDELRAPEKSGQAMLCAHPSAANQFTLHRPAGCPHLQVQLWWHGRRRMRLSLIHYFLLVLPLTSRIKSGTSQSFQFL